MSERLIGANRRTLLALLGAGLVILTGYVFFPHWSTRYGAWLVLFWIWMAWFVATAVRWISRADF